MSATSDGSIDIDVSDFDVDVVTLTRAELEQIKNSIWADARRLFQGKAAKPRGVPTDN